MSYKPAQKRCWECTVYKTAESRHQTDRHSPGFTQPPLFCEKKGCYVNAMSYCRDGEWKP